MAKNEDKDPLGDNGPMWRKIQSIELKVANLEVLMGQLLKVLLINESKKEISPLSTKASMKCPECRGSGIGSVFSDGDIDAEVMPCRVCGGDGETG